MMDGRIFAYGSEKNWWSRAGKPGQMPTGEPGGPDSEMFYQFDIPHDPAYGKECHPNCDCGRFIEIGNNVFMEYKKLADGKFELLKQRNVDFGGGLERTVAAVQNKPNIFETDLFEPLIQILPEEGIPERTHRIIADHCRAAAFLICDGVTPSNKEQGYVLRRLMRRVIVQCHVNGIELEAVNQIFDQIVLNYGQYYPELKADLIKAVFAAENEKFQKTFKNGLREMEKMQTIDAASAFKLFESFGLPFEVIQEVGKDKAAALTREGFEAERKHHQEISRAGAEKKFGGHGIVVKEGDLTAENADEMRKKLRLHTATHLVVAALENVLGQKLKQAGADITAERLRFDFAFPRKVTPEELKAAEDLANQAVSDDLPVTWEEMQTDDAFASGASGAFRHKYGDHVKVYTMGDKANPFSKEICGGPHVTHTGEVGHIHITKEESVSGGNRRIRATVDN